MPAIGYVATGSALFFSALVAGSYAFGTADESTGVASREATMAYSQAANQATEANQVPETAKREHGDYRLRQLGSPQAWPAENGTRKTKGTGSGAVLK